MYYIWSWRHSQWWGPNRAGYTSNIAHAGRYAPEAAGQIVVNSGLPGNNTAVHQKIAEDRLADESVGEIRRLLELWRGQ
jgi:hypothetical protein